MNIHHIGYLVKNIEKARSSFVDLGFFVKGNITKDDYRQIRICFLEKDGYLIELVSPTSKESVVFNLLKKVGNNPYHICYVSNDYVNDVKKLLNKHYVICSESHDAIALDNKKVCFLINSNIGMIEIVEE